MESFSSKIRKKTKHPLLPMLFDVILEVLTRVIRQGKKIKGIQIEKKWNSLFADDRILYIENHKDSIKNIVTDQQIQ